LWELNPAFGAKAGRIGIINLTFRALDGHC
jgi:hypothetical protein